MALDAKLLRDSFALVAERAPDLTKRFYAVLFERYPQARPLFRADMTPQEKMLTGALVAVLDHVDDAPWLRTTLLALGAKHVDYGVRDEMYGWVGECLLATLAEVAAEAWTPATAAAWNDAVGAIASIMIEGAATHEGSTRVG